MHVLSAMKKEELCLKKEELCIDRAEISAPR